ncbi:MAG: radical SAM family heme chaperone HemW [Planctomycetota bacterium]|nr:radical SAM family heme chaperone HemW [Planctomycetota bacterium]
MTTPLQQLKSTSTAPIVRQLLDDPELSPVRCLYIHIPFCFHKCHYCDFYSLVDTRDRQQPFTDRLGQELAALAPLTQNQPLRTIFIGGGTPTLLQPALWTQLLRTLDDHFNLAAIHANDAEFSVECNPETASPELFDILRAGGVNRLSMGAQSFNPRHLKTLERWHDPKSVPRAVALAKTAGIERTSVDLIFAIPGQTLPEWDADLATALTLGTTHLSCYALTYEPNTAMTARLKRGDFTPTDDDLEADMYEHTVKRCADAGLDRYEVSNFAAPGHECAHNLAYWSQSSWLAAGPSASSHLLDPQGGGWRWKNQPRLDDYLHQNDNGHPRAIDLEPPDPSRLLSEQLMTAVRLREGIDLDQLLENTNEPTANAVRRVAADQLARGCLQESDSRLRPTDSGFLVADGLAREFLSVL